MEEQVRTTGPPSGKFLTFEDAPVQQRFTGEGAKIHVDRVKAGCRIESCDAFGFLFERRGLADARLAQEYKRPPVLKSRERMQRTPRGRPVRGIPQKAPVGQVDTAIVRDPESRPWVHYLHAGLNSLSRHPRAKIRIAIIRKLHQCASVRRGYGGQWQ
jgi:hypothetical protein